MKPWLAVWTVVTVTLVVGLLAGSEGVPVCEGPLIEWTNDSFPPDCNDPIDALPRLFPFVAAFGLLITAGLAAGVWLIQRLRGAHVDRADQR